MCGSGSDGHDQLLKKYEEELVRILLKAFDILTNLIETNEPDAQKNSTDDLEKLESMLYTIFGKNIAFYCKHQKAFDFKPEDMLNLLKQQFIKLKQIFAGQQLGIVVPEDKKAAIVSVWKKSTHESSSIEPIEENLPTKKSGIMNISKELAEETSKYPAEKKFSPFTSIKEDSNTDKSDSKNSQGKSSNTNGYTVYFRR